MLARRVSAIPPKDSVTFVLQEEQVVTDDFFVLNKTGGIKDTRHNREHEAESRIRDGTVNISVSQSSADKPCYDLSLSISLSPAA